MNGYKLSTPRAALGVTATAMAAITMSALVVLPAEFDSVRGDPNMLAATEIAAKARIEAAISPARADISGLANHEERLQPGRVKLGAQQFRGKRHTMASRTRADT
jgi:hypothetical protein